MERRRRATRRASDMHAALLDAVRRGRLRQAQLLVEAGAGVDGQVGEKEETPLLACVTRLPQGEAKDKMLRLLLDAGADTNAADALGRSALMHAAILGYADTVQLLLENPGVDLELEDSGGNTALMHAARHGHTEVVAALLRQMGRLRQILHLSQRNRNGRTAVELAQRHGHARVAAVLGCCAPTPTTTTTTNWRPSFPRAMTDDRGDADNFPNPRLLERGPTPGSPLLSFPARWQQRQQRRRAPEAPPDVDDDDNEEEEKDDLRIDSPDRQQVSRITEKLIRRVPVQFEPSGSSLPRLRQSERRNGDAIIDLDSSYGSCRSDDSSGYDSSGCKNGVFGWTESTAAAEDDCRREDSSVSLPPGHDRFRRVLNLLDAAIQQEDEAVPGSQGGAGVSAGKGALPLVTTERTLRAPNRQNAVTGKSNYFPPLRQRRPLVYAGMLDRTQHRPVVPPIGHRKSESEEPK